MFLPDCGTGTWSDTPRGRYLDGPTTRPPPPHDGCPGPEGSGWVPEVLAGFVPVTPSGLGRCRRVRAPRGVLGGGTRGPDPVGPRRDRAVPHSRPTGRPLGSPSAVVSVPPPPDSWTVIPSSGTHTVSGSLLHEVLPLPPDRTGRRVGGCSRCLWTRRNVPGLRGSDPGSGPRGRRRVPCQPR